MTQDCRALAAALLTNAHVTLKEFMSKNGKNVDDAKVEKIVEGLYQNYFKVQPVSQTNEKDI